MFSVIYLNITAQGWISSAGRPQAIKRLPPIFTQEEILSRLGAARFLSNQLKKLSKNSVPPLENLPP